MATLIDATVTAYKVWRVVAPVGEGTTLEFSALTPAKFTTFATVSADLDVEMVTENYDQVSVELVIDIVADNDSGYLIENFWGATPKSSKPSTGKGNRPKFLVENDFGPSMMGDRQFGSWWATPSSNSLTENGYRMSFLNHGAGIVSAYTAGTADEFSKFARVRCATPPSSNITAGVRTGTAILSVGHGFYFKTRFGFSNHAPGWSGFVGLAADIDPIAVDSDPSSVTNILGIGWDEADTNLFFMHNDAAGKATKVDLGLGFPSDTSGSDIYDLHMYVDPTDSSKLHYIVERVVGGPSAVSGVISTNLPATSTMLSIQSFASNRDSGAVVEYDFMGAYWETFF